MQVSLDSCRGLALLRGSGRATSLTSLRSTTDRRGTRRFSKAETPHATWILSLRNTINSIRCYSIEYDTKEVVVNRD